MSLDRARFVGRCDLTVVYLNYGVWYRTVC